jgi:hypothetical protein
MHWEFQIIQEYAPKGKIVALILLIGVTLASIVLEVLLVSDIAASRLRCRLLLKQPSQRVRYRFTNTRHS